MSPGVPEEQRIPVGAPERLLLFGWHLGAQPRGDRATPASGSWPPRPRPRVAAGRRAGDQSPAACGASAAGRARRAVPPRSGRCGPRRSHRARGAGQSEEPQNKASESGKRRALSARGRAHKFLCARALPASPADQPREGARVAAPRSRRQARGTHKARTVPLPRWRGSEKTQAKGAPLRPRHSPSENWRLPTAREAQTFLLGRRWLVRETKETWAGPGERRAW